MAGLSTLSVQSGDIIVADFPGVMRVKRRPSLIMSSETYHAARPDVILAVLTGQVAAATAPTHERQQQQRGSCSAKSVGSMCRGWQRAWGLPLPPSTRALVLRCFDDLRQPILHVVGERLGAVSL